MGEHGHNTAGKTPSYETRDVNVRALMLWGAILAVIVIASFIYMRYLFVRYTRQIREERPAPVSLVELDPMPPAPRLRVNAMLDIAELRAYEDDLLTHYAWVSEADGVARVPVTRAMGMIVEHGLPAWPAPAAPVEPAATNAPAPDATAPAATPQEAP